MEPLQLPPEISAKIEAFKTSKAAFLEWREQYRDLETKAANQTALAEAAEAEANQHQEALRAMVRDLVRAEAGDKEAVNTLDGKAETARSLAAEHRAYAADLLAEAENFKLTGFAAANKYLNTKDAAIVAYTDYHFKEILREIEGPLLKAIQLRIWFHQMKGDIEQGNDITRQSILDVGKHLNRDTLNAGIDSADNETLDLLQQKTGVWPFAMKDFNNPLDVRKKLQALAKNQEAA